MRDFILEPSKAREFRLQINKFDFNFPTTFAWECSCYQLLLSCGLESCALLPVSSYLAGHVKTCSLPILDGALAQSFPLLSKWYGLNLDTRSYDHYNCTITPLVFNFIKTCSKWIYKTVRRPVISKY